MERPIWWGRRWMRCRLTITAPAVGGSGGGGEGQPDRCGVGGEGDGGRDMAARYSVLQMGAVTGGGQVRRIPGLTGR